jgi:putative transcriptional regulator
MDDMVTEGSLLAAWPDLLDPNFHRAVVVMCRHNEEGAFGLVVNRATGITLDQLVPDHPVLARISFPVHLGGPVDHQSLQFLHTVPEHVPGGLPITEELYLGGADLEDLARYLQEHKREARVRVRLFLGYSGWGAGQLEGELAAGSWVPAPLHLGAVFGTDMEATWLHVLRTVQAGDGADEGESPDLSWN